MRGERHRQWSRSSLGIADLATESNGYLKTYPYTARHQTGDENEAERKHLRLDASMAGGQVL